MQQAFGISVALAIALSVLLSFAFVRRAMRSPSAPAWLNNDAMGYILALLFTVAFTLSTVTMAFALGSFVTGALVMFLGAAAVHVLMWMIVRLLIPLRSSDVLTPGLSVQGAVGGPDAVAH